MIVFASNRTLAARCDGIEERTLRRRLKHLADRGLVDRKMSPNGKRYQVKSADTDYVLAYGIDLSPLCSILLHLEALAHDCRRDELRIRTLKSVIRDRLYNFPDIRALPFAEDARRALRRKIAAEDLQHLLDQIDQYLEELQSAAEPVTSCMTAEMTATDSQNVRHIQSSKKEECESEGRECEQLHEQPKTDPLAKQRQAPRDITVSECMEAATTARTLTMHVPKTWSEVSTLARTLGPSIGIDPPSMRAAEINLGEYGSALAVLGLVEAFERVRSPQAYLNTLVKKARATGLDCVKMFWSLTQPTHAQKSYA
jgi:replication initiation protein RepC